MIHPGFAPVPPVHGVKPLPARVFRLPADTIQRKLYVENDLKQHRIEIINKRTDSIRHVTINVEELDSTIGSLRKRIDENVVVVFRDSVQVGNDSINSSKLKLDQRIGRLKNVAGKMAFESWRWEHLAELDTATLKKVFREELTNRGIPIDFEFGYGNQDTLLLRSDNANSVLLHESPYRTMLFPNDIISRGNFLLAYFPGRKTFITRTLLLPAFLSLFFSSIVLVSFVLSISYIIKQKKISEMKSDFINNMTHEFKTPLATISLATDTLVNPKIIVEPVQIEYFAKIIRKENNRLNHQVETILQMASLDRKDYDFNFRLVNVHDTIVKAIQDFQLQIDSRNGQVEFDFQAGNPLVTADQSHLFHAICNLIDNAIKYSAETLVILIHTHNSARGVWVSVTDKGIGMPKNVQTKIFEKFYRESNGNIHNVKGFGLGLSYVKAITEAHKGEVRVESEPGKGSTFELFLPFVREV
jgi:two-component system phosphate regulon sensor histidine kinase PhoR